MTTTAQTRPPGNGDYSAKNGTRTTTARGAGTTEDETTKCRRGYRDDRDRNGEEQGRYRYDNAEGWPASQPLAPVASQPPPPAQVHEGLPGKRAPALAPGAGSTGASRPAMRATTMGGRQRRRRPLTMVGGCERHGGWPTKGATSSDSGHHVRFFLPLPCSRFPSTCSPAPLVLPFLVVSLY